MITDPELLKSLLHKGAFMPQEEMLEIKRKKGQLFIGIPKETSFQERRVALVPEAVSLLVANGHRVMVETGAGDGTNFTDTEYSEAGAEISYDKLLLATGGKANIPALEGGNLKGVHVLRTS
jgi:alanine dehydrogenase